MSSEMLEAALLYAQRGWRVLPCWPRSKVPLTWPLDRARKEASRRKAKIEAWWERHPQANVAVALGRASGLLVLDIKGRRG